MNPALPLLGILLALAPALPAQRYLLGSFGRFDRGNYGAVLAVGGDFDGDGMADLLIGSPNRSRTGAALIGSVTVASGRNGLVITGTSGTRAGRRLGFAVAALGDVNGDGVPDFASSSPHDNTLGTNAGYAACYSGADSRLLWEIAGAFPGAWFGQSVLGVPDMDGDGRMDVAVGAPRQTASIPTGRIYFYSGRTGGQIRVLTSDAGGDHFGHSLALVGDQNGDRIADLVVGAPLGLGYITVFQMGSTNNSPIWSRVQGNGFGETVAGVGDTDGDGIDDVLVGRPETALLPVPTATLVSGRTTRVIRSHVGNRGEVVAPAVGGGLDLDADGATDYVLGAPRAAGGAGQAAVYSGRNGALLFTVSGNGNDATGSAVALLPDRTGDGLAEVALGNPGYDTSGVPESGSVTLYAHLLAGRAELLGDGCRGANSGTALLVDTAPLRFGGSLRATAPRLPPNSIGLWFVGLDRRQSPLDLTALGMPGCLLRTRDDITLPFSSAADGSAVLTAPIANDPSLTGAQLDVQGLCSDPGSNALGLMLTQAWNLRIGNS
ncbi:MAG: FG-GAP repeat protein [Planctomycetes bacterium]|nr:FG-GAP repeat protein [Planctomycetota bacterium]